MDTGVRPGIEQSGYNGGNGRSVGKRFRRGAAPFDRVRRGKRGTAGGVFGAERSGAPLAATRNVRAQPARLIAGRCAGRGARPGRAGNPPRTVRHNLPPDPKRPNPPLGRFAGELRGDRANPAGFLSGAARACAVLTGEL